MLAVCQPVVDWVRASLTGTPTNPLAPSTQAITFTVIQADASNLCVQLAACLKRDVTPAPTALGPPDAIGHALLQTYVADRQAQAAEKAAKAAEKAVKEADGKAPMLNGPPPPIASSASATSPWRRTSPPCGWPLPKAT